MQQTFFPLDKKFLYAIIRLDEKNDADWKIIKEKISEVSASLTQLNLHGFPDFRLNYNERFHTLRGISASLDLLKNIFSNPGQLITELEEQDEFLEAQEKVRKEQEGAME